MKQFIFLNVGSISGKYHLFHGNSDTNTNIPLYHLKINSGYCHHALCQIILISKNKFSIKIHATILDTLMLDARLAKMVALSKERSCAQCG